MSEQACKKPKIDRENYVIPLDVIAHIVAHLDKQDKITFRLLNKEIKELMDAYFLLHIPQLYTEEQIRKCIMRSGPVLLSIWRNIFETCFSEIQGEVTNPLIIPKLLSAFKGSSVEKIAASISIYFTEFNVF